MFGAAAAVAKIGDATEAGCAPPLPPICKEVEREVGLLPSDCCSLVFSITEGIEKKFVVEVLLPLG